MNVLADTVTCRVPIVCRNKTPEVNQGIGISKAPHTSRAEMQL